ncbi:AAA family ATPase [Parabacteroides sp.]|uniref:AAA family ATPase n=1 Tax=Parabacteroides sp. TaxID=1869337 RepID=UPI00257BE970|nr:AAA family ATPase [Parabacteroides sp.]
MEINTFKTIVPSSHQKNDALIIKNTVSYKHKTYDIPSDSITGVSFSLGYISLNTSSSKFATCDNQPSRLFIGENGSDDLIVTLDSCKVITDGSYDLIYAHLYRVGMTSPIASRSAQITKHEAPRFIFNEISKVGDYFLFFPGASEEKRTDKEAAPYYKETHGGIRLFFSIFHSGNKLKHPIIRKASVVKNDFNAQNPLFSSGKIRVTFDLENIPEKDNEFALFCYTTGRTFMASSFKVIKHSSFQPAQITFYLSSDRIWIPGEYILILAHNRYPFLKYSFTISSKGEIATRITTPESSDTEFWMVSKLELGIHKHWRKLLRFGGIYDLVKQIQTLESEFKFWKHKHPLYSVPFFTITSESSFTSARVPMILREFFNKDQYEAINCNGKEKFWEMRWQYFADSTYREDKLYIFYHIDSLANPENENKLKTLCQFFQEDKSNCSLFLCGSKQELEVLYNMSPEIEFHMGNAIPLTISNYSLHDVLDIIVDDLSSMYILTSPDVENHIYQEVCSLWEEYQLGFWTLKEIQQWIDDTIVPTLEIRCGYAKPAPSESRDSYILINKEDIDLKNYLPLHPLKRHRFSYPQKEKDEFEKAMKELNEMVGLTNLKEELSALFYKQQMNNQRKMFGLPSEETSTHHVIFTGNPGTGKTTVARLMGRIFKAMGILSKGDVICTERSQLVKPYIGHTEEHIEKVLEEAKGNVLFIDEAYSLCDSTHDRVDFGNHVIEALLTKLTDPDRDMVVILAGYEEDFKHLLEQNRGLKSRFVHTFHFEDYTAHELMQIGLSDIKKKIYKLTPNAESRMQRLIEKAVINKDHLFSNGRWVKQLVNNFILPAMAKRVMNSKQTMNVNLLTEITLADVEQAEKALCKQKHEVRRKAVGFL